MDDIVPQSDPTAAGAVGVADGEPAWAGILAEGVAEWCRQLSGILLQEAGEQLVERLRAEVDVLRTLIDGAGPGEVGRPQAPPYRDRKGRLRHQTNPVTSARNPLAPPMVLVGSEGESEFSVVLPIQYQGPPKSLHGGYVSVLLDEALWHAVRTAVGGISFTRELTVTYDRPVPLGVPLTIRGRVRTIEDRKTFAEGEILAGGTPCARASGLWVAPRR